MIVMFSGSLNNIGTISTYQNDTFGGSLGLCHSYGYTLRTASRVRKRLFQWTDLLTFPSY